MEIPKKIQVGGRVYTVYKKERLARPILGRIDYEARTIEIATRHPRTGKPFTPRQQAQTFWHEMTHAILRDMNHRLEASEDFVDRFAVRLNNAIHNAKF